MDNIINCNVMEKETENKSTGLSNLIQLAGLAVGVFLIIFLKHTQSKNSEPLLDDDMNEEGGVKIEDKFNERQNSILNLIKKKKTLTPSEIYSLSPNVSTRTLRRDMDVLVENGVVIQEGSTKSTKYTYTG